VFRGIRVAGGAVDMVFSDAGGALPNPGVGGSVDRGVRRSTRVRC
jgi:hypothetical protein